MRIALISTCAIPVPPSGYGGTERVVAALSRALVDRGHEVFVYATGDSQPAGTLRYCFARSVWPPDPAAERRHGAWAWRDLGRLSPDVVHLNSPEALLEWSGGEPAPVVTIHHGRDEQLIDVYARAAGAHLVAISQRQAALLPTLRPLSVVHHGLDPAHYPAGPGGGGYGLFLGRIAPEKAPHLAIDAARKAGLPLLMGAPRWDGDAIYETYYESEMKPRLDWPALRWPGEFDQPAKVRALQAAEALLVPMAWEEPFGLVMIEAMLVGTPVVAFRRGSAPEVIDEGVTGFIVGDADAMAQALPAARRLDRVACRKRAQKRFSAARMAADYEAVYQRALRGTTSDHLAQN
jgi:glycosyltransferase involved in cell wall biosynthesis